MQCLGGLRWANTKHFDVVLDAQIYKVFPASAYPFRTHELEFSDEG